MPFVVSSQLGKGPSILVTALEASADLHAATVLEEVLRRVPSLRIFGVGGPALQRLGMEVVARAEDFSVMGFADVASKVAKLSAIMLELVRLARQRRPVFALLVDSPDFTLRLGQRLKLHGTPVAMLIAPQAWAWRVGRAKALHRSVDLLLTIFPFEEDFFARRGVRTHFIGHPLAHRARLRAVRAKPARAAVAFLPGSRLGEVTRHLDVMLAARKSLQLLSAATRTVVSVAPTIPWEAVAQRTERTLDVQLVEGVDEALAPAALAVSVSGTASLEAALAGVPTVVIYKMRPSTHMVARLLVRTPFIAMANVVHGGELFPELIQNDVTAAGIVGAAARVLERAEAIKPALHQLAVTLAPELDPAPAVRAAELLLETWPESLEN